MPELPGLLRSRKLWMNACRSSVVPIVSMISTPLTSFQSCHVETGSTSPAETQNLMVLVSSLLPARAYSTSPRKTAGTAKKTLGLYLSKSEAITCGVGRSLQRITEQPVPIGNEKLLPSP